MSTEEVVVDGTRNEVCLAGRVSSAPVSRELPSGDHVVTFRLVMQRDRTPMTAKSRQSSDWVDCAAWGARARRSAASWQVGDQVQLEGALRRRFFRDGTGPSTRLEVEMISGRCLARAGGAR
ncbi:MAG TPA: single-stranded DNA-binding protein [Nocardioidaceae bacterium]|nr:single-stranded DNA-binding protein [Nocardioidaceae bacterium]